MHALRMIRAPLFQPRNGHRVILWIFFGMWIVVLGTCPSCNLFGIGFRSQGGVWEFEMTFDDLEPENRIRRGGTPEL